MTKEITELEKEHSFSPLEYTFPIRDPRTYHNLQVLEEITKGEEGLPTEFELTEDGCKILVDSYSCFKDDDGDGCILCSVGSQSNLKMLLFTRQMPLDGFEKFARIEPHRRVLLKEENFLEDRVVKKGNSWELVSPLEELGLIFTVSKSGEDEEVMLKATSLNKILESVSVRMIPRSLEHNYAFGILNGEDRFVDKSEYEEFVKLVTAATGNNGSLDGIRTEEVFVDIEGVETEEGRILFSISF